MFLFYTKIKKSSLLCLFHYILHNITNIGRSNRLNKKSYHFSIVKKSIKI